MKLKLDMSCHLLNAYTKFQIDISKHVEKKSGKLGRTDGWTDMNAEKWLWLIFGCKVGQSVPIGMKLELDVWHYLLNVYTMFQNDIPKHVEKKPGKLRKIQNAQK